MQPFDPLIDVRQSSEALVRSEVRSMDSRAVLEQAVRDAVLKMGASIDAVSEASGITPDEVRSIVAKPAPIEGLDVLAGVG